MTRIGLGMTATVGPGWSGSIALRGAAAGLSTFAVPGEPRYGTSPGSGGEAFGFG